MKNKSPVILLLMGAFAVSVPLSAHHGAASYDSSKTVTVKGTVTEYLWSNPHVFLKVDAKDDSGNTVHWTIEASNPVSQIERGWNKNTFRLGDEVIVECVPAKNGKPVGLFHFPTLIVINGKEFKS